MDQFGDFLTKLLIAVITAAVPTLTVMLVTFLFTKFKSEYAKLKVSDQQLLEAVARMAVAAAEQSGFAKLIADTGAEKKAWALQFAQDMLAQYKIKIDVKAVDAALEAAIAAGWHRRNEPMAAIEVKEAA